MKPLHEIADAAQATAASKKVLEQGVDGLKLFVSAQRGATLPEKAVQAAVDESHRMGKPVFAHPNTGTDVLTAVRSGVDVIAHTTPASGPWDGTVLSAMKERQTALIPTLWLWKYYARHDRVSTGERITNTAVDQLRAWLASGGTVLFGTDLGAVDPDPREEYVLMAQAGMTFRQILASLTTAPAERFGESKRLGRIVTGFDADLVVLEGDPSTNIRALASVKYTVRAGRIIYRAPE
ncbi:MAG: amidohydrolase family protein, partial [Acidobacteria bacterium]|nr:amidohydrolase family protein [Acidobacteriota bacterium]